MRTEKIIKIDIGDSHAKIKLVLCTDDDIKYVVQHNKNARAVTIKYLSAFQEQVGCVAECRIRLNDNDVETISHEAGHLAFAIAKYAAIKDTEISKYEEWFCRKLGEIVQKINDIIIEEKCTLEK